MKETPAIKGVLESLCLGYDWSKERYGYELVQTLPRGWI